MLHALLFKTGTGKFNLKCSGLVSDDMNILFVKFIRHENLPATPRKLISCFNLPDYRKDTLLMVTLFPATLALSPNKRPATRFPIMQTGSGSERFFPENGDM